MTADPFFAWHVQERPGFAAASRIDNPYWREVGPFVELESGMFRWGGPYVKQFSLQEPPGMTIGGPGWAEWYRGEIEKLPNRRDLVSKYSWAVTDPLALSRLREAVPGPVVEIGAGSGYWAYFLEQLGADVVCYDENPPGDTSPESSNHWHPSGHQWVPVLKAGLEAIAMHQDRTLMLCWPPYADAMAERALQAYEGDTVVYVGESHGGCTAGDGFFELLAKGWTERHTIGLAQWEGMHDVIEVWTRGRDDDGADD